MLTIIILYPRYYVRDPIQPSLYHYLTGTTVLFVVDILSEFRLEDVCESRDVLSPQRLTPNDGRLWVREIVKTQIVFLTRSLF